MSGVFLCGILLDAALREIVAGGPLDARPATLDGWSVCLREDGADPILVEARDGRAEGLLVKPDEGQADRIAFYAAGRRLTARRVTVTTPGGPLESRFYPSDEPDPAPRGGWDLADWQRDRGAEARHAAVEAMSYHGRIDGATLRARMPTIALRAASRARAEAQPMPNALRRGFGRDAVRVVDRRAPYTRYFAVEETDLAHRRFDGTQSATLNRAALVSGDAVTVLPYDPVRDRVMLVEQFRFGPLARGDRLPWTLEPIAGRIDPGETPETAARREAVEEANLTLGRLLPIASHYPSPGALSEYLFSYVALADLPDAVARCGGKVEEGEDIRAHVISFDALMALVASGEADNGPLLLSAFWLEHRRRSLA